LVQLGQRNRAYSAVALAAWLRENYAVDTRILNDTPLDSRAYDTSKQMYVAELIDDQLKRDYPDLAADPKAFIIGFTDAEMYRATNDDDLATNERDGHRVAIISSAGLDSGRADSQAENVAATMQRALLHNIAILFWHLPRNNNPSSLLYYWWTPDIQTSKLSEADLNPLQSQWGEALGEPCLVFTYSATKGIRLKLAATKSAVGECDDPESPSEPQSHLDTPDSPPDVAQEQMQLRLREGRLYEKHTYFFLPGVVPIRFERATSNEWEAQAAFGISGSHNYDRYLSSSDSDMLSIYVESASGDAVTLSRPPGQTTYDLAKWTDESASKENFLLQWRGGGSTPHFDLTRYNGEVDSYLPCLDGGICYLSGYHDAQGNALIVKRDPKRNLLSLRAPGGRWLSFNHPAEANEAIRITKIADSAGRQVVYGYNTKDQLTTVTYPSGEIFTYVYDDQQDLLTVSVKEPTKASLLLVTNEYEKARLVRQTFVDGRVYKYRYREDDADRGVLAMDVTDSDGNTLNIDFSQSIAVVRQLQWSNAPARSTQPMVIVAYQAMRLDH